MSPTSKLLHDRIWIFRLNSSSANGRLDILDYQVSSFLFLSLFTTQSKGNNLSAAVHELPHWYLVWWKGFEVLCGSRCSHTWTTKNLQLSGIHLTWLTARIQSNQSFTGLVQLREMVVENWQLLTSTKDAWPAHSSDKLRHNIWKLQFSTQSQPRFQQDAHPNGYKIKRTPWRKRKTLALSHIPWDMRRRNSPSSVGSGHVDMCILQNAK